MPQSDEQQPGNEDDLGLRQPREARERSAEWIHSFVRLFVRSFARHRTTKVGSGDALDRQRGREGEAEFVVVVVVVGEGG